MLGRFVEALNYECKTKLKGTDKILDADALHQVHLVARYPSVWRRNSELLAACVCGRDKARSPVYFSIGAMMFPDEHVTVWCWCLGDGRSENSV